MHCGAKVRWRAWAALMLAMSLAACTPATGAPRTAAGAQGAAVAPPPPSGTSPAAPTSSAAARRDEQRIPEWVRRLLPDLQIDKAPEGFALVDAPMVVITPRHVVFQGRVVARVAELVARGRVERVEPLYVELKKIRVAYMYDHPRTPFPGVVLFWVDKRVPEVAIKDVTQTAISAGFSKGSFVVRDEAAPDHFTRLGPVGRGRLPPAVIQRIVREHYGKFRFCYERALANDPKLTGSVVVSFEIEPDGTVGQVVDHGSTLADKDAVQCIFAAYQKLVFPKPEGGKVTVVYPIEFSPK